MAAAAAARNVNLKLFVDKNARKVVFAEADKPFVDFLFNLMTLPLGTVIKLVSQNSMMGSLGNLYGSIQNLSDAYLRPNLTKDVLLNPKVPTHSFRAPLVMAAGGDGSETKRYYICCSCHGSQVFISCDPKSICPNCNSCIDLHSYCIDAPPVRASDDSRDETVGFVKGVVRYMVMDNLKVMPHSTASTIAVLNEYNIKDIGSLEVKDVPFGVDEGLKVLKAALHSADSVLTNVFLGE